MQLEDLYGWFDYTFNRYLNINDFGHGDFLQSPRTILHSEYSFAALAVNAWERTPSVGTSARHLGCAYT